jgi:telomerase reverse transcriptase
MYAESADAKALIRLNQYEPVALHNVMQGLAIADVPCLGTAQGDCGAGLRQTASTAWKNRAIAEDLVFWIFNDLLIPLLRASLCFSLLLYLALHLRSEADSCQNTFYVTETASTRYSTVYFLHEHWEEATGPHFATLERNLLEPLSSVCLLHPTLSRLPLK